MAHQRTVYHPTREELLAVVRDAGAVEDYYDSIGQCCEDEEEDTYARALGYNPELNGE